MIRRAKNVDIDRLNALLYQVQQLHADGRPDIFKNGAKKYTTEELNAIIAKQAERIEQLSAPQPRRAARRNELPDQISLDDLLK